MTWSRNPNVNKSFQRLTEKEFQVTGSRLGGESRNPGRSRLVAGALTLPALPTLSLLGHCGIPHRNIVLITTIGSIGVSGFGSTLLCWLLIGLTLILLGIIRLLLLLLLLLLRL